MLPSLLSAYIEKVKDADGNRIGYLYEDLWTEYASTLLSKVFLFAAIFLAVALIVIGIVAKKKNPERFASFLKVATGIAVSFALTVILTMLALGFAKIGEKEYMSEKPMLLVLIPPMILAGIAVLGGIVSYISNLSSKKAGKIALYVTFGLSPRSSALSSISIRISKATAITTAPTVRTAKWIN